MNLQEALRGQLRADVEFGAVRHEHDTEQSANQCVAEWQPDKCLGGPLQIVEREQVPRPAALKAAEKTGNVASRPDSMRMRACSGAVRASDIAARSIATALSTSGSPASARPKPTSANSTGASPSRSCSSTDCAVSALRRMTA